MDIYITNLETKERIQIPMLPSEIKGSVENKFASYNIIKNGEVRIPIGTSLDVYSWSAKFPGEKRNRDAYIRAWTAPKECDKFMRSLQTANGKAVKARLLITETHINLDVYLQSYSPSESGGYGDISYSVKFIRAKKIEISKSFSFSSDVRLKNTPSSSNSQTRTSPPASKTHTVVKGECMWGIAQKYYGNGSLYTKIYEANKAVIDPVNQKYGKPKYMIYPGQKFIIP